MGGRPGRARRQHRQRRSGRERRARRLRMRREPGGRPHRRGGGRGRHGDRKARVVPRLQARARPRRRRRPRADRARRRATRARVRPRHGGAGRAGRRLPQPRARALGGVGPERRGAAGLRRGHAHPAARGRRDGERPRRRGHVVRHPDQGRRHRARARPRGSAPRRHRRRARLGRDALHGLSRRRRHRRRRRLRRQPARRQRARGDRALSAADGSLEPELDPEANLATMLGLA